MHFLIQRAPQLLVTQNKFAHHLTAVLTELVAKARLHAGAHPAARYLPIEFTLTALRILPAKHIKAHSTVSFHHRSCILASKLHDRFGVLIHLARPVVTLWFHYRFIMNSDRLATFIE